MKKQPDEIDVEEVAYHRNGVGGEGFHVVKFRGELAEGPDGDTHMVAVVFDEPGAVAVFDRELLGMGMIAFGQNSWRGDNYEEVLRAAIDRYELGRSQELLEQT